MKNIGIFYGSATGTTAEVAKKIGELLGVSPDDIHNVADTAPSVLGQYGTLVLGSSTWGNGELEDDWFDFIDGAQALDLKGHKIALFGCGDETMSDTFCNAVGILYDKLKTPAPPSSANILPTATPSTIQKPLTAPPCAASCSTR